MMTGLMHEREFSRKTFVKGGGALIVGFSMLGTGLTGTAGAAGVDPFASAGPPDAGQIDSWIVINPDNTAFVKLGKIDLGQGSLTGLLMIAGEELDLPLSQLRWTYNANTDLVPNQGPTVGSSSIQRGGKEVRGAAAAARAALLDLAAKELGVSVDSLSVSEGVVSGGGKSVTYGDLLGGKLFNVKMAPGYQVANTGGFAPSGTGLAAGAPLTKPVSQYKLVMTSPPRLDIPWKVTGQYTYVHQVRVPGMLHGRIVRPRGQGGYGGGTAPAILSVDQSSIAHIPGVQVVQNGNFLGVVAPKEWDAIQAAAQLKVKWAPMPPISGVGNLFQGMRSQDSAGKAPARIVIDNGNFDSAFAGAAHTVAQTYKFNYNGHLPIGPTCCVADVTSNGAVVYSNTQDIYGTRQSVKDALDQLLGASKSLPLDRIRLIYYEGASVYGSAPYRDAAQAASVMSAVVGAPVRVQFMRWDEHGWDNYGPAQMTDIRAGVDGNGNIVAFEFTATGIPYYDQGTPATLQQLGQTPSFQGTNHVDTTLSGSQYSVANRRVIGKSLPLENNYFKVTYLRSPDAPQSGFAAEQAADELAHMAGMDPVAFRLQNIATTATDPAQRWKNVLVNTAKLAGWQPKVAASNLSSANVVTGRGIAFGAYAGTMTCCVADIQVNKKTGKITVLNLHQTVDAGLIVYPGGLVTNQVGAAVQGVSRALVEQVSFDTKQVTSLDWVSYPMLRFKDTPKVVIEPLQRTDVPDPTGQPGSGSTGAGEPALPPVAPAVANAFFDATGVRIREAPMTPARVRGVLQAAGVA